MANKYESLAVFIYPFDSDSGGNIRWKSDVIACGVTGVNWAGGEFLATTRNGEKRVRFVNDGQVEVEDIESRADAAEYSGELSGLSQDVDDFFASNSRFVAEGNS